MTNKELQFILSMKDEATAKWNQFKSQVETGATKLKEKFVEFGGLLAGAFSVIAMKQFVEESNQAEKMQAKLTQALHNAGISSKGVKDEMLGYSKSLMEVTTYDDDVITGVQATLVAMTGLTGRAVQPLTKATLDLASGLGMDVDSVALLIAKSIDGMDALGRYGISLKDAHTQSEKIALITSEVARKFGGFAENEATTTAGKMKQLEVQIGNLKESFGDLIKGGLEAIMPALSTFVKAMTEAPKPIQATILSVGVLTAAITFLSASLLANPITWVLIGITGATVGLTAATMEYNSASAEQKKNMEGLATVATTVNQVVKVLSGMFYAIVAGFTSAMTAVTGLFALIEMGLNKIGADSSKKWQIMASNWAETTKQAIDKIRGDISKVGDSLDMLSPHVENAKNALNKIVDTKAINSIASLKEQEKKLQDELEKLPIGSDKYIQAMSKLAEVQYKLKEASRDLEYAQSKLENQWSVTLPKAIVSLKDKADSIADGMRGMNLLLTVTTNPSNPKTFAQVQEQIQVLQDELDNTEIGDAKVPELQKKIDGLKSRIDSELMSSLDKVKQGFATWAPFAQKAFSLISMASQNREQAELNSISEHRDAELERIDTQLSAENLSEDQKKKLIAERARIEKKYRDEENEAKRKSFESNKMARVIQSIIDTASAVVEALPDIPLSIVVGALGLAQTGIIASQPTPQFHEGGIMGYSGQRMGLASDERPAILRVGETVRTVQQESELRAGGSGQTFIFNFNTPVPSADWVVKSITDKMRQTGLPLDKLIVNQRERVVLE